MFWCDFVAGWIGGKMHKSNFIITISIPLNVDLGPFPLNFFYIIGPRLRLLVAWKWNV